MCVEALTGEVAVEVAAGEQSTLVGLAHHCPPEVAAATANYNPHPNAAEGAAASANPNASPKPVEGAPGTANPNPDPNSDPYRHPNANPGRAGEAAATVVCGVGRLVGFGWNGQGQLGLGSGLAASRLPAPVDLAPPMSAWELRAPVWTVHSSCLFGPPRSQPPGWQGMHEGFDDLD